MRLPWVVGGTVVNVGGILLVMQATSLTRLTLTLMVALVGQGAATAGYQAMMPEVVPRQRWGLASGYMGLASLAGTIAGLGVAGLTSATVTYQNRRPRRRGRLIMAPVPLFQRDQRLR